MAEKPAGPCKNVNCRSYGTSHFGCKCYSGTGAEFSEGGYVCSGAHDTKCFHFADGGQVEEQTLLHSNPNHAIDHIAAHHGLHHVLTKLGKTKSEAPGRVFEEYVDGAKRGLKHVKSHSENIFSNEKVPHEKGSHQKLKEHLQDLQENPDKMFDIGGNLGDEMPDHAAVLAGKMGNAIGYLNSLKPASTKTHPLDPDTPPDKIAESKYDRQLGLAENPVSILNHVKDGSLQPQDVTTVKTLYPDLAKSIGEKAFAKLIDEKTKGKHISYKHKMGLSLLLGQPLDSTMTPQAMQAIMASQGPQQAANQSKGPPKKKASGVELSQINKTNELYQTNTQDREAEILEKD